MSTEEDAITTAHTAMLVLSALRELLERLGKEK